jgi:hypothetical protein
MQRLLVTAAAIMAVATAAAGGALADAGPPGTTFPEQPSNVASGCNAVTTNPGSGFGGVSGQNASPTAIAITTGLIVDACFGG